jgi:hypothetical protein
MSNFGGTLSQPKKNEIYSRDFFVSAVEGYGGSTAYAGNVKKAARRETCAETFYDTF